jgi:hypothetical protein
MRPCSQPRKCQTWPSVSDSDGKRDSPLRTLTILAGIPHANTIDYGNRIPAGTNTTEKMWAFNRNPHDFPSPNVVRPGRFLGELDTPYANPRGRNASD